MSEAPAQDTATSQQVSPEQPVTEDQWVQRRREARSAERAQERQVEPAEPETVEDAEEADPETVEVEAEEQTRDADLLSEVDEAETEEVEAEDTTEEDAEYFPETVPELAEKLGFDPDELSGHLKITVKPNGHAETVSLAELAKGYERHQDYKAKTQALADQRRSFEATTTQALERQKASIAQLDTVAVALAQQIDMGPDDAEIARIGREEPHRYPQVVEERKQRLEAFNKAQAMRQQAVKQAEEQNRDSMVRYRADQQKRLAEVMPAMSDPSGARKVEETIRGFLTGPEIGFTDDEVTAFINGPFDHRQVLVIAKAAEAAAQGEVKNAVKKKVNKLPKLSKSKARQPKRQQGERLRSAKQRLKTDQSTEAGLELLRARRQARRNATHGGSQ